MEPERPHKTTICAYRCAVGHDRRVDPVSWDEVATRSTPAIPRPALTFEADACSNG
jgi:hypothetical protein